MPLVSIVVPTLNEERYIAGLLASIEAQTYPGELIEVLIADGGSTDETRAMVKAAADASRLGSIYLVNNPERTTAHGLNAGAEAANGGVIIILGGHSAVDPSFVEANVEALRRTGAAAVGGPLTTIGEGAVASAIAASLSHPFGVGNARFRYATEAGDVDTVAFAAYRRECFELLGGFDPAKDKGEDDDFNFRIRQAGGRIHLDPEIRSTYYARSTMRGVVSQYFGYGKAKGRAFRDTREALGPRHYVPSAMVVGGAALTAASLFSRRSRVVLGLLSAAYGLAGAVAAQRAVARAETGAALWRTFLVFPLVHVSYGSGMLIGAWQGRRRPELAFEGPE
ncbi:hypothetical protein AYO38_02015 [bacterium SCGC AG-212-C10]|nr:hypothetical protein AYO38_02015 [bacterium SCGC AG-212-C10]